MKQAEQDNVVWATRYDEKAGTFRQTYTRYRLIKAWRTKNVLKWVNIAQRNGWTVSVWNYGVVFKHSALMAKTVYLDEQD